MRHVLIPAHIDPTPPALGAVTHAVQGQTMGTTWSVTLSAAQQALLPAWRQGIQQRLDEVVAQMSAWDDHSDLSRFNRAPAGTWHVLPEAFFSVLTHALRVAEASAGAYDPTAGALVNLWGFGPTRRAAEVPFTPPSTQAIAQACSPQAWQRLRLDPANRRALQPGGVCLDLSAIAKGFGVDQVARYLQGRGIDSFLVEVGGELRGEGVKPDGQPWWVTLEPPGLSDLPETLVALHGLSVATSGDYRRYVEADGTRYSHTLDPRDGWPIRHGLASVSVLHRDAMAADAWSTALNVLGVDDGLALAEAQGLPALFTVRNAQGFEEHASGPLKAMRE